MRGLSLTRMGPLVENEYWAQLQYGPNPCNPLFHSAVSPCSISFQLEERLSAPSTYVMDPSALIRSYTDRVAEARHRCWYPPLLIKNSAGPGLNVYIKEPGSTNHSTSSDKLHPVSTRPGAVPQVYIEVQLNETLVKTFTMEFPPSLSKIHETAVKSSFEKREAERSHVIENFHALSQNPNRDQYLEVLLVPPGLFLSHARMFLAFASLLLEIDEYHGSKHAQRTNKPHRPVRIHIALVEGSGNHLLTSLFQHFEQHWQSHRKGDHPKPSVFRYSPQIDSAGSCQAAIQALFAQRKVVPDVVTLEFDTLEANPVFFWLAEAKHCQPLILKLDTHCRAWAQHEIDSIEYNHLRQSDVFISEHLVPTNLHIEGADWHKSGPTEGAIVPSKAKPSYQAPLVDIGPLRHPAAEVHVGPSSLAEILASYRYRDKVQDRELVLVAEGTIPMPLQQLQHLLTSLKVIHKHQSTERFYIVTTTFSEDTMLNRLSVHLHDQIRQLLREFLDLQQIVENERLGMINFGGIAQADVMKGNLDYCISNCGWSTLSVDVAFAGVPVLLQPTTDEQWFNARLWEHHGRGVIWYPDFAPVVDCGHTKVPASYSPEEKMDYLVNQLKDFENHKLKKCRVAATDLKQKLDVPNQHFKAWEALWLLLHGHRSREILEPHPDGHLQRVPAPAHLQPHRLLPGHPQYVEGPSA